MFNCVWLFATPWTVPHQDPLCPWNSPGKNTGVGLPFPTSRGSSWPKNQTHISCISCIGRQILYHCATWEALLSFGLLEFKKIKIVSFHSCSWQKKHQNCWTLATWTFLPYKYIPHLCYLSTNSFGEVLWRNEDVIFCPLTGKISLSLDVSLNKMCSDSHTSFWEGGS